MQFTMIPNGRAGQRNMRDDVYQDYVRWRLFVHSNACLTATWAHERSTQWRVDQSTLYATLCFGRLLCTYTRLSRDVLNRLSLLKLQTWISYSREYIPRSWSGRRQKARILLHFTCCILHYGPIQSFPLSIRYHTYHTRYPWQASSLSHRQPLPAYPGQPINPQPSAIMARTSAFRASRVVGWCGDDEFHKARCSLKRGNWGWLMCSREQKSCCDSTARRPRRNSRVKTNYRQQGLRREESS